MATPQPNPTEPLLPSSPPPPRESWCESVLRKVLRVLLQVVLVFLLVGLFLQALSQLYSYGRLTGPPLLQDFKLYPGDDLLPPSGFSLVQQEHRLYSSFEVFPSDEEGRIVGGSIGYFFKVWGPFWDCLGLADEEGRILLSARATLFALSNELNVYRADGGHGFSFRLVEGKLNRFLNFWRKFLGNFVRTQYSLFKVDEGGAKTLIGVSSKQGFQAQQLILKDPSSNEKLFEGILVNRHWMGRFDFWTVHGLSPESQNEVPAAVFGQIVAASAFRQAAKKSNAEHL